MSGPLEKVTAFITRPAGMEYELLLFEHPYAGIQIPAGTVEAGESPEAAVLREAGEETGLTGFALQGFLGRREEPSAEGTGFVREATKVYSRPDPTSFDWAAFRHGIQVRVLRRVPGFVQASYEEPDRYPDPQYLTLVITGWVPEAALTDRRIRYFFHLEFTGLSESRWTVSSDNHPFTLFWARRSALPEIVYPQNEWLAWLP